jgi:hypothetical protein
MKVYKAVRNSVVDVETGDQILVLVASNCSAKFTRVAAKELVNKLNSIERGKACRGNGS